MVLLALLAMLFQAPTTTLVEAATGMCEGSCVFNETMTCDEMIEDMEFHGDCCSMSDHSETGNCVITVMNGSCGWTTRCDSGCSGECGVDGIAEFGCVVPYTLWSADDSLGDCPVSSYDVSGTECTIPFDPQAEFCPDQSNTPATPTVADTTEADSGTFHARATGMGFAIAAGTTVIIMACCTTLYF